jgi:ADP-heptose:LPS heptosyltransferase
MIFLLKKLKFLIQGTIIDTYLRLCICYLSKFYFRNVNPKKDRQFEKCLIILYGGMGDCILLFPLINKLSQKHNVDIFIEDKFFEITKILSKGVNCIKYQKNEIFKKLSNYGVKNKKFILLQQSPIFEFLIFNFFLGRPPVLGFIYNQRIIEIQGLDQKVSIKTSFNKIQKYELFYNLISKKIKFLNSKVKLNKKENHISTQRNKNYFVLAPSKTSTWRGVGLLEHSVYLDTMFYIYKKTKLIPVLVGSKEDLPIIKNLIINKPKELHIKNLVGKTNLKDLIQIVKNAKFVISNDNGIHHLSNYLNVKTLTFFTFSSYVTLKWNNNNSFFIFNKKYQCMPCIGNKSGPFDNYPFSCPWQIRCKDSITVDNIIKKIEKIKLI